MKITFIRTNMFEHICSDAMKPLLFGIIKKLTPMEHEIEFIDERVEKLPEKIDSDIIAFSVETFTAKRSYILARKYKFPGNIIVMGGFHTSVLPDEALEYADSVIIGDAEDTWGRFLADCGSGRVQKRYVSDENVPLLVFREDRSVYRHHYYGVGVCQISRGCKWNCDFCSIKTMYQCIRRKSAEDVYAELKGMREKIIFFADDNLFYDKESAMELIRKIAPLKKKWACQISMDAARDDELLGEMKKSGCFLVLMGFESLNGDSLATMNKRANSTEDYAGIIKSIHRHKMLVYGTFVLGYDGDAADVFGRTYRFAVENDIAVTNFNPLIPMPGTPVYKRFESDGRLLYGGKWWLADDYRYGETAFVPAKMSPEELRDGCLGMRLQFYSARCVLKRLFANPINFLPWNFFVFVLANAVSHREIPKKQGQMLGGMLGEADFDKT